MGNAEVQLGDADIPAPQGTARLEAALQARNGGMPSGLGAKPKAKAKAQPKAKPKAKAKAHGKKVPSLKRPASKADQAENRFKKPAASVGMQPARKSTPGVCKKRSTRELKMTRDCVYSRAYHGAQSSLAKQLSSSPI